MKPARPLRKKLIVIGALLALFLLIIQFIRPPLENPPVTGDLNAPPEVKNIVVRSCYDCHSNETKLAWFDKPQPAYSLVAGHVKEGRSLLNFSNWDSLTKDQQKAKLFESLNQIVFKEMPLSQYSFFHRDARISDSDIHVLRNYLSSLPPPTIADTSRIRTRDAQYDKWIASDSRPTDVQPEFNGLSYLPDYRDWQAISTTERWDNGTMRVILGNPIAVAAIREGHTNPWPDGSTFAKVAWEQQADSSGIVRAGQFIQVELMVKDKEKYASTEEWGWGRWKGPQLKPYGKDALFTTECTHCHQPMHDQDFVFTTPVNWRAQAGTGTDTMAFDPLQWKVIGSRIDLAKRTISTLYGNDIALRAARKGMAGAYPAGSVIGLVTWSQKEEDHWFGANIPASIQSVQKIGFGADPGHPSYEQYSGQPLTKVTLTDSVLTKSLIAAIAGQKASVMP